MIFVAWQQLKWAHAPGRLNKLTKKIRHIFVIFEKRRKTDANIKQIFKSICKKKKNTEIKECKKYEIKKEKNYHVCLRYTLEVAEQNLHK